MLMTSTERALKGVQKRVGVLYSTAATCRVVKLFFNGNPPFRDAYILIVHRLCQRSTHFANLFVARLSRARRLLSDDLGSESFSCRELSIGRTRQLGCCGH